MNTWYGIDVGAQRSDDLDKKLQEAVSAGKAHSVLDLGCGSGSQARVLADKGAVVTAVDKMLDKTIAHPNILYLSADMRDVPDLLSFKQFDACVCQRAIHYLTYKAATQLLVDLHELVTGQLYISFSGLESDIGATYPDATAPLPVRFASLPEKAANTFGIKAPLCLYTPEEAMVLLTETGWEIDAFWVSAFGNSKAICTKST